ncbi:glutaredoxin-like protein [Enterococcus phage phiSHEF13]|uniref:Glutaredoxin-like protein n=3 Tax=Schiekvirus TaxID=2732968 RepID=A0AAE9JUW8_9CAUD|nr:putative ribonucleotide reductase [Enterococcus phage EfsSzw-1]UMO76722.1 glutaredoxin-like protein [Enterococcus phage phiSHEF13]UVD42916.1 hypothetical protein [Enterococcus phage TJE1]
MPKVTVYSKNGCGQCTFVKRMLKGENIIFEERNIDQDPTARDYLVNKSVTSLPYVETSTGISFTGVQIGKIKEIKNSYK